MSRAEYVFGYGSLVRSPGGHVAELLGHERRWGVAMDNTRDVKGYKYYLAPDGSRPPVFVAFLDVAAAAGASVHGVCTPVDSERLARLDARERNYERVDVTAQIGAARGRTWAYVGSAAGRERFARGGGGRRVRDRRGLPAPGARRLPGARRARVPPRGALVEPRRPARAAATARRPLARPACAAARGAWRAPRRSSAPNSSSASSRRPSSAPASSSCAPAGVRWIARLRRSSVVDAALGQAALPRARRASATIVLGSMRASPSPSSCWVGSGARGEHRRAARNARGCRPSSASAAANGGRDRVRRPSSAGSPCIARAPPGAVDPRNHARAKFYSVTQSFVIQTIHGPPSPAGSSPTAAWSSPSGSLLTLVGIATAGAGDEGDEPEVLRARQGGLGDEPEDRPALQRHRRQRRAAGARS